MNMINNKFRRNIIKSDNAFTSKQSREKNEPKLTSCLLNNRTTASFLPLDKVVASRAVFAIGSDGNAFEVS